MIDLEPRDLGAGHPEISQRPFPQSESRVGRGGAVIYIPISGRSMLPTLRPLDLLEVVRYEQETVQVGDVVAFLVGPADTYIVHRVVRVQVEGIRTLGDNNRYEDGMDLQPQNLTGRVVAAWRGPRRRVVQGGQVGHLVARAIRVFGRVDRALSGLLRPVYRLLARSGVFRAVLPRPLRPMVVRFRSSEHASLSMHFLGREIGRYDRELRRWVIRRPFKLFLEEDLLPRLDNDGSGLADRL